MLNKKIKGLFLGVSLGLISTAPAYADMLFKVQTSVQSGGYSYKYLNEHWVKELANRSKGTLKVELLPINSVMPKNETPEAVGAGILGGDLTSIAYFSGRNPAFAILGDLIAGYDTPEQVQGFCRYGGGAEVLQKTWDKVKPNAIHVVGCGSVSKEALVARIPIQSLSDLKGVKIRSPEGLAASVFRAAGASPINIPFSEVFTSLEKGVVDAADASAYVNNDQNGFNQIARYPLYPGIHSMAVHQFTISKKSWEKLTSNQKTILTKWFYDAYSDLAVALDKQDKILVARDKKDPTMHVINWGQSDRDEFRKIAQKAWEETASKSPEARVALDAEYKYMKEIGLL